MKNQGFTLIEVMIVLVIMATLTVLSSQSITQALKNKTKLQSQVDEVSQVRDALKIIERDVNLAFHYQDIDEELKKLIKKERSTLYQQTKKSGSGTTTTTLPGDPPPPPNANPGDPFNNPEDPLNQVNANKVKPETHFIGDEEKLDLVTMNAGRLSESHLQADFVEVGYSLQSCREEGDQGGITKCLLRRMSSQVDTDPLRGGEEIVLLKNVEEFKLRYIGKGKTDWSSRWSSKGDDGTTAGKFPDAVEISLKVAYPEGNKKKTISMQIVASLRHPNNPSSGAQSPIPAGGTAPAPPPGPGE